MPRPFRHDSGNGEAAVCHSDLAVVCGCANHFSGPRVEFPDGNRFHESQCVTLCVAVSIGQHAATLNLDSNQPILM